ncbi:MAG: hypothetical protein VB814_10670, partial [Pirellulaceae bacterium]
RSHRNRPNPYHQRMSPLPTSSPIFASLDACWFAPTYQSKECSVASSHPLVVQWLRALIV